MRARDTWVAVEGAALDQTLDHPAVHRGHIDAPAKIEERIERSVLGSAFDDYLDGFLADILDASQTEANFVTHWSEIERRSR